MRSYQQDERGSSPEREALAEARGIRPVPQPTDVQTRRRRGGQMRLFGIEGGSRRREPRRGRNARMAARLDEIASVAERAAASASRQGNAVEARRARERAEDAKRAAAMLRAGPGGVGDLIAS